MNGKNAIRAEIRALVAMISVLTVAMISCSIGKSRNIAE